jgi:hypothetical protein
LCCSGTHTECQYSLLTFGVPIDMFPITSQGELKRTNHLKWIAKRRVKESHFLMDPSSDTFDRIDLPSLRDVLIGKGKPFQRHPGNVHLRTVIGQYLEKYVDAKKRDKPAMFWEVVDIVKKSSGRFLKKDRDGWWIVVTDDEAREKVGKTFTSARMSAKQSPPSLRYDDDQIERKRRKIQEERGCFGSCS